MENQAPPQDNQVPSSVSAPAVTAAATDPALVVPPSQSAPMDQVLPEALQEVAPGAVSEVLPGMLPTGEAFMAQQQPLSSAQNLPPTGNGAAHLMTPAAPAVADNSISAGK